MVKYKSKLNEKTLYTNASNNNSLGTYFLNNKTLDTKNIALINRILTSPYFYQKGTTTVEYCVVSLGVIVALFVPLGGEGSLSGVGLLLQGLRNFQMHSTYLLSLP